MPKGRTQPYDYIYEIDYSLDFSDLTKEQNGAITKQHHKILDVLAGIIKRPPCKEEDKIKKYTVFVERFNEPVRSKKLEDFKKEIQGRSVHVSRAIIEGSIIPRYRGNVRALMPPTQGTQKKEIKKIAKAAQSLDEVFRGVNWNSLCIALSSARDHVKENPNYEPEDFNEVFNVAPADTVRINDFIVMLKKLSQLKEDDTANPVHVRDPYLQELTIRLLDIWVEHTGEIPARQYDEHDRVRFGTFHDFQDWVKDIVEYALSDKKLNNYSPIVSEQLIKEVIEIYEEETDETLDKWPKKNSPIYISEDTSFVIKPNSTKNK